MNLLCYFKSQTSKSSTTHTRTPQIQYVDDDMHRPTVSDHMEKKKGMSGYWALRDTKIKAKQINTDVYSSHKLFPKTTFNQDAPQDSTEQDQSNDLVAQVCSLDTRSKRKGTERENLQCDQTIRHHFHVCGLV
jgi:hypothetical protein